MSRIACVDVPELPLQLLLRQHPDWRGQPSAVLREERPQGLVLWSNREARRTGVVPGLRYSEALSLCPELQAGVVEPSRIARGVKMLRAWLLQTSPEVEPAEHLPGVFWLNASGMEGLHPTLEGWAQTVHTGLGELGFEATVVVGFSRFGSSALARSKSGILVLADAQRERKASLGVRLDLLGLGPAVLKELNLLGIRKLGDFLQLPADGVLRRFGPEAHRLYLEAAQDLSVPLQPLAAGHPLVRHADFEPPEQDWTRLLFVIKRLLHPLLTELEARGQALGELRLRLEPEEGHPRVEVLRPAAPTLELLLLLELVRLRLETLELTAPLASLALGVRGAATELEQLRLFEEAPRRNRTAADQALARIRAELGEGSVVCAELREAHLPEAGFHWQPLYKVPVAQPVSGREATLIRRMHAPPVGLGHQLEDLELGPYIVSGGWWVREVHREYYFVEAEDGPISWVYYDSKRRRWFLQGTLE